MASDAFGKGTSSGNCTTAGTQSKNTSFDTPLSHSGQPETAELIEHKAESVLAWRVWRRLCGVWEGKENPVGSIFMVYEASGTYLLVFLKLL